MGAIGGYPVDAMNAAKLVLTALLSFALCQPAVHAGGFPSLSGQAYLEQAAAAIEEALDRGDPGLVEEFAALSESGAYATEPLVGKALKRRVVRLATARLASTADTASAVKRRLAAALTRLEKPPQAPAPAGSHAPIRLPADEAAHMRLAEWWYINGHLRDDEGREYGYELTFFHVRPGIFFVHTAITDIAGGKFHRRREYLSPLVCRTPTDRLDVVYGKTHALTCGESGRGYAIRATTDGGALALSLRPLKAPMMVNGDGIIDMPEGTFSWYYSMTRLATAGELELDGKKFRVAGLSWMDHQWGNFVTLRIGWDWFSVQLDDGSDFNIFSFRKGNSAPIAQYVNRLDGAAVLTTSHQVGLERLAWWKSPETGKDYVTRWRLAVPGHAPIDIESRLDGQELPRAPFDPAPGYWEGKCRPSSGGVGGVAYCEQFAYPR